MPNLRTVLKNTMFMFADPGGTSQDLGTEDLVISPAASSFVSGVPELKPIWRWRHDAKQPSDLTAKIAEVKKIECFVRDMGHMMPVCDTIQWKDIVVTQNDSRGNPRTVTLPLQRQFLLQRRFLKSGSIDENESHPFWRLKALIDSSLLLVFGFEVDFNAEQARPLADVNDPGDISRVCDKDDFMPGGEGGAPSSLKVPVGGEGVIRIGSVRVVVALQLICCKEREDFEPKGALGAARLYPLVMVMANRPLDLVRTAVAINRPAKTNHTNMPDGEEMKPEIGSSYFTDSNSSPFDTVPPFWDFFFDYFMIDPPPGGHIMVHPVSPAEKLMSGAASDGVRTITGATAGRVVKKLPGQGEFDSIHLAPKMVASERLRKTFPDYGFDDVTMAPFCVHDCLHIHWRWGEGSTGKNVRGWSGFTPYARPGAPLVPPSQRVTLHKLSPNSIVYEADILQPKAHEWQVVMHHGTAYAISTNILADLAKDFVAFGTPLTNDGTWASFYWNIRYHYDIDNATTSLPLRIDRVQILDLDKAREIK